MQTTALPAYHDKIWGLGNSVVIQIHWASKLDSQLNHYPMNMERRRVCYNVFHKNNRKVRCDPFERLCSFHRYTNPAPMTQTPSEDSLSIFQISRVRLANSAQTILLEIHYYFSKYRERPPPLLCMQITESILCAVNK
jgi:hypothetical protein